jgi:predicted membrane channel-forming protein YqfA (hemolysin III family)
MGTQAFVSSPPIWQLALAITRKGIGTIVPSAMVFASNGTGLLRNTMLSSGWGISIIGSALAITKCASLSKLAILTPYIIMIR